MDKIPEGIRKFIRHCPQFRSGSSISNCSTPKLALSFIGEPTPGFTAFIL